MKKISLMLTVVVLLLMSYSCGVGGDPGHCYLSIDGEYYSEDYGVYYYEDDNPDVPDSVALDPNIYYDCYPGTFNYSYKSVDNMGYPFTNEGTYTLIQELGTPARLFEDGMDGIDTYFDLFLYVYARKGLRVDIPDTDAKSLSNISQDVQKTEPILIEKSSWEEVKDGWKLVVEQTVKVYPKH